MSALPLPERSPSTCRFFRRGSPVDLGQRIHVIGTSGSGKTDRCPRARRGDRQPAHRARRTPLPRELGGAPRCRHARRRRGGGGTAEAGSWTGRWPGRRARGSVATRRHDRLARSPALDGDAADDRAHGAALVVAGGRSGTGIASRSAQRSSRSSRSSGGPGPRTPPTARTTSDCSRRPGVASYVCGRDARSATFWSAQPAQHTVSWRERSRDGPRLRELAQATRRGRARP